MAGTQLHHPRDAATLSRTGRVDVDALCEELSSLPSTIVEEDWETPSQSAIENAKNWIYELFEICEEDSLPISAPSVGSVADGRITFDWRRGERSASVYISDDSAVAILARGPKMIGDMQDWDVSDSKGKLWMWEWLLGVIVIDDPR